MAETRQGTTIKMPKLGESVTEGTIAGWLKKVGDRVDRYDPMVEVVTDKVNAEVPAPVSGTLIEIISAEGDVVPVGEAICVIDTGDGTVEVPVDELEAGEETEDRTVVMSAAPMSEMEASDEMIYDAGDDDSSAARSANGADRDIDAAIARAREDRDEQALLQIRSSPLVRRLAEEHSVDLTTVEGTGIGGRVTKSDIEAYIARPDAAEQAEPARPASRAPEPGAERAPAPAPRIEVWPGDEVIEASTMRRQIAEHMVRSVSTAPHVTVWMEVDMSAVVNYREAHKAEFQEREGFSLTYVPLVLSTVVESLQEYPEINAVWDNGRIIRRKAINIGLAVALEDGLIVPVLKRADEKNITGLARAVNDLVERARDGKLSPDDVSGGTFTLNNPGTLGSISSTPLLVQPQAGILSMEAIVKRPVVVDDMIGIRPMMNLSMSVDHRLLDGLAATRFLSDVKQRLEHFRPN
ncbi:MAG: dihydrolipoamide acetyltransferase family protein [Thermomicrobiales bacterium]